MTTPPPAQDPPAAPTLAEGRHTPRKFVCPACQDHDEARETCGECGQTGEARWLFGQPRAHDIGYLG